MAVADITLKEKNVFFSKELGGRHLLTCQTLTHEPLEENGKWSNELCIQLFDKSNLDEIIGEKKFSWPEKQTPQISVELKPNLLIIFKGKLNVAQLPFEIPRRGPPKLPAGTRNPLPFMHMQDFGAVPKMMNLTQKSLTFAVQLFLQKPTDEKWKELVKKCEAKDESLFCEAVTKEEAIKLVQYFQENFEEQEDEVSTVFDAVFKNRIISTTAFGDILKELIESQSQKLLFAYLKCPSTIVVDEAFAPLLKYALTLEEIETDEMFVLMCYKGFTAAFIRRHFAEILTTKEAVRVLDIGVDLVDQKANNNLLCDRIIQLLLALIDSYGDKLVWEEESYTSLRRAKDYIQSLTEMTTAFTRLLSKSRARSKLPELEAPVETDYTLETVQFRKITII